MGLASQNGEQRSLLKGKKQNFSELQSCPSWIKREYFDLVAQTRVRAHYGAQYTQFLFAMVLELILRL